MRQMRVQQTAVTIADHCQRLSAPVLHAEDALHAVKDIEILGIGLTGAGAMFGLTIILRLSPSHVGYTNTGSVA